MLPPGSQILSEIRQDRSLPSDLPSHQTTAEWTTQMVLDQRKIGGDEIFNTLAINERSHLCAKISIRPTLQRHL